MAPKELAKLLELLVDKALATDTRAHRDRCAAFGLLVERFADPELFVPMLRALRAADQTLRGVLVPLFSKVNDVSRHADLCQTLGAREPEVRKAASLVLRQLGGTTALEVLQSMVRDPAFAGRFEAMDALVSKAGHHAIPLLSAILFAGDPNERGRALTHLSDARLMAKDLPGSLRAIAACLDDIDPRVVTQAMVAVATLAKEDEFFELVGDRIETKSLEALKALIEGLRKYGSPRTLEFFTRKFRDGPTQIRLAILEAIGAGGHDTALGLLVEALSNRRVEVRTRAADVIAELSTSGRIDVARAILWLLRSRDVNVRRIAVEIARKVGDKSGELAPRMLRQLRDEDWWVRERVMDALSEMAGQTLTKHLLDYLQDPSDVVRRFAVGGLVRLKDPRSLGALVRSAMNDADWWVREQAIEAAASLGDPRAIPYLLEVLALHADAHLACIQAFAKLGAKQAIPKMCEFLSDDDPNIRVAALECLGALDDRSVAQAVKECEKDDVFRVRTAAQALLQKWQVQSEVSESTEALSNVLDRMLVALSQAGGDDLVLATDRPPYVKRLGKMTPFSRTAFSDELMKAILFPLLSRVQLHDLDDRKDVDLSYEVKTHKLRFRAHVFHQMTGLGAVFRIVKNQIPTIEELGLPDIVRTFADFKNGLVLVGGPTGSGKSTTLAAMINAINRNTACHIVTIEDPIEVVHGPVKSLINQREVGSHTPSFASALRSTLRQDPDVILVGELRDLTTIAFAVTAAETGHLVFGTVHTVSADTSIDRLINTFPTGQQPQVRSMLAETLRAVVCQHLLRKANGSGRVLAVEVMLNNDATANLIRKGKTFQIPTVVATSRDTGMQSMDSDLLRLCKAGLISQTDALIQSNDKKAFEVLLGRAGPAAPAGPAAEVEPGGATGRGKVV
ncbi:MAG: PilT/PilU family type 4a pilus ATPase, partial [Myxococcales bacterium]